MNLQTFNGEFGAVRVTKDERGEIWFALVDVCRALDIKNPRQAKTRLKEKGVITTDTLTNGGIQKITFINEPNLYRLILQSRKKEAIKFQDWVTEEVLPAIRKTGMYATAETLQQMLADPRNAIKILEAYAQEQEKRKALEQKVNILTHTGKTYTATEIAKELGFKSAIELNKKLQEKGIQYKVNKSWVLSAKYADLGYTSLKQKILPNGAVIYDRHWTQKGREFLLELFSKDNSTKNLALPANNNQLTNSTQAG
ncbi:anti-repressor protein [Lebetimonas natsushimae]|uniref:Anti-repressor protein n=1 Tax=Lebetimonas natsushimae TaxID=1936991 RepID=A0A292YBU0_9BACT|nr:phage antirepressor KilAC domain-containing protein [Lebetimonas natsushimae]GAX87006.1 anti-repressor protein [Lebetimonas natsushimae]